MSERPLTGMVETIRTSHETEARPGAETSALEKLDHVCAQLWKARSLQEGLDAMLAATIELLGANAGNVQLVDSEHKVLVIASHRGFEQDFVDFFREVSYEAATSCARALRSKNPIVIEDLELDAAFEPYRAMIRGGRLRAVMSTPLVGREGTVLGMLSAYFRMPHRPADSDVHLLKLFVRQAADFIERFRSEEALRESEERLRLALAAGHMPMWDWDSKTGAFVWNDECYRILGYEVGEVEPSYAAWATRVHPDDLKATETALASARRDNQEYVSSYRILHPDGSVRWVRARGKTIYRQGKPVRMVGLGDDVTEVRQQVETQRVLVAELQHRTRNLIAVVQSIGHQILRTASSLEDFEDRFNRRLAALSRAQSLLSRSDKEPITMRTLVVTELDALSSAAAMDKIEISGPEVLLRKSAVEMLSLAIHELATNAAKHGALARKTGHLSVCWRTEDSGLQRRLTLEWVEDGIAATDTERRGYGRTLIEEALPFSISAQTRYELSVDRLRCVISLPLRKNDAADVSR